MRHGFCLIALFICGVLRVYAQSPTDSIAFLMDKGECIICGESDANDCIQRHTEAIALAIDKYARIYNLSDFSFNYDVIDVKQLQTREIVTLRIGNGADVQCTRKTAMLKSADEILFTIDLCIKSAWTTLEYQYQYESKKTSTSKTSKCLLCQTVFDNKYEK